MRADVRPAKGGAAAMSSLRRPGFQVLLLIVALGGLLAVELLSSGVLLEGASISLRLLGDRFPAAQLALEQRGFACGAVQSFTDQQASHALACNRVNARRTPPEDQVFRVELSGPGDTITRVTTRVCGSVTRPCPIAPPSSLPDARASPSHPGQPPPPGVAAAFAVFAVVVTAAWCLDWRHYVRFWLGRHPNYQGRWVGGLRVFFALCLLGALQMVFGTFSALRWTVQDFTRLALWSGVMIAAAAAFDGIFRFMLGRPTAFLRSTLTDPDAR